MLSITKKKATHDARFKLTAAMIAVFFLYTYVTIGDRMFTPNNDSAVNIFNQMDNTDSSNGNGRSIHSMSQHVSRGHNNQTPSSVAVIKNYTITIAMVSSSKSSGVRDFNFANLSIQNHKQYAKKHGYAFELSGVQPEVTISRRRPHWAKIFLLRDIINRDGLDDTKWIWWIDLDTLIMNDTIAVADLIDDHFDFIVSPDCNDMNTGSFLLKHSQWSLDFLQRAIQIGPQKSYPGEQGAIIRAYLMHSEIREKTKIIDPRVFNSRVHDPCAKLKHFEAQFSPGDFVVHFAGLTMQKDRLMIEYAGRIGKSKQKSV